MTVPKTHSLYPGPTTLSVSLLFLSSLFYLTRHLKTLVCVEICITQCTKQGNTTMQQIPSLKQGKIQSFLTSARWGLFTPPQ